jgi:hypothetical protein
MYILKGILYDGEQAVYYDETGDRLQHVFRESQIAQTAHRLGFWKGLKLAGFWTLVFWIVAGIVLVKLWTMGALAWKP